MVDSQSSYPTANDVKELIESQRWFNINQWGYYSIAFFGKREIERFIEELCRMLYDVQSSPTTTRNENE